MELELSPKWGWRPHFLSLMQIFKGWVFVQFLGFFRLAIVVKLKADYFTKTLKCGR
jgi:hypothetical protein